MYGFRLLINNSLADALEPVTIKNTLVRFRDPAFSNLMELSSSENDTFWNPGFRFSNGKFSCCNCWLNSYAYILCPLAACGAIRFASVSWVAVDPPGL